MIPILQFDYETMDLSPLVKHCEAKVILKTRKFRTYTTVVESDIHHPTDFTLFQDGVKVIT